MHAGREPHGFRPGKVVQAAVPDGGGVAERAGAGWGAAGYSLCTLSTWGLGNPDTEPDTVPGSRAVASQADKVPRRDPARCEGAGQGVTGAGVTAARASTRWVSASALVWMPSSSA